MTFTWNLAEKIPYDQISSILDIPEALRDKEAVVTKSEIADVEVTCVRYRCVLPYILPAHLSIPAVSEATSCAQMLVPALAALFKTSYFLTWGCSMGANSKSQWERTFKRYRYLS